MITKLFVFFLLTFSSVERSEQIDLQHACQDMWAAAGNNLDVGPNGELRVNVPGANPLFTVQGQGGANKINSDEFTKFEALLVDYQANPPAPTLEHIYDFLDEVTQPGGAVEAAFIYLTGGPNPILPGVNNLQQFRCLLEDMWFVNSHGFEHVFVGEKQGQNYKGFHNWYQFYLEQARNPTETTNIVFRNPQNAFVNSSPPFLKGLIFTWRGLRKPGNQGPNGNQGHSSMFVGTSPAFDLAMFSTCFLKGGGQANQDCRCRINGRLVRMRTIVDNQHAGKIKTAYPTN